MGAMCGKSDAGEGAKGNGSTAGSGGGGGGSGGDTSKPASGSSKPKTTSAGSGGGGGGGSSDAHKLILLGPGESGKSTIFKQMKLINLGSIPLEERKSYVVLVRTSVLSQMRALCKELQSLNASLITEDSRVLAEIPLAGLVWDAEVAERMTRVWQTPDVRRFYDANRGAFTQVNDGAAYLFDQVARIAAPDYVPDEQDLLRVRIRTQGYETAEYEYKKVKFSVWDVGGQRSERKHWRACVEGAKAMIFVAALSEYDQRLREDADRWRMEETLLLWEEVVNSSRVQEMSVILFLNKADIFRQKIQSKPITEFFHDYDGPPTDFDATTAYIRQQFLSRRKTKLTVYPHVTTATDTSNIRHVWEDIVEICRKAAVRQLF